MNIKDKIGEPASNEDVKSFEQEHDFVLPEDYKNFLVTFNGGRPEKDTRAFTFKKEDGTVSDSLVGWFNGLIDGDEYSLEEEIDIYDERIPAGMLPIASDPFGNAILIGVSSDDVSGVWFWDHEIEPESINDSGIYKIAESFDQFLAILQPVD